ncbi:MAG: hypothetical protein KDE23_00970, partial [Caldilinea sp.]|nr:hypothetical protein [Caldilinea sp.]
MVNVTDRPHIHMGLCPLEYCLGHVRYLLHCIFDQRFVAKLPMIFILRHNCTAVGIPGGAGAQHFR